MIPMRILRALPFSVRLIFTWNDWYLDLKPEVDLQWMRDIARWPKGHDVLSRTYQIGPVGVFIATSMPHEKRMQLQQASEQR